MAGARWRAWQGLDGAVVLSSSVQLADKLRLACGLAGHPIMPHGAASAEQADPAVGRIMIVKAYLGCTSQVGPRLTIQRMPCAASGKAM